MKESWKEKAGYDDLTEEQKAEWDEGWAKTDADDLEKAAADKLAAGFADMTTDEQVIFEAEALKWAKSAWEVCLENKDSIEC